MKTVSKTSAFSYNQSTQPYAQSTTVSITTHFPFNFKRPSFTLQKTAFYTPKGDLSQRRLPPFAKLVNYNTVTFSDRKPLSKYLVYFSRTTFALVIYIL